MGFGFNKEDKEKEKGPWEIKMDFQTKDILAYHAWETINIGQRVQSLLTKTEGTIAEKHRVYKEIKIEWDNGNESLAKFNSLTKVVTI